MKTAIEYAVHWDKQAGILQAEYESLRDDYEEKRYDTRVDSEALITLGCKLQATDNALAEARQLAKTYYAMLPDTLIGYTLARGILKEVKS
jgi:hypothetical protein